METQERYETGTECPQNGHSADSAAFAPLPRPASPEPVEWWEADRMLVHLVLAKRRAHERLGSVKVGESNYLGPEQRPLLLMADPGRDAQAELIEQLRQEATQIAFQMGQGQPVERQVLALLEKIGLLRENSQPWGEALEKLITQAVQQAQEQQA